MTNIISFSDSLILKGTLPLREGEPTSAGLIFGCFMDSEAAPP